MKTTVRGALDGVYIAVWLLLVAAIWLAIGVGVAFPPLCAGEYGCLGAAVVGGGVVLVSLVLLVPFSVVVARLYRRRDLGAFPVSTGFFMVGLVWLVVLAIRFPSVHPEMRIFRGDAIQYWLVGGLPTAFAWILSAWTARNRRMRTLAKYVGLAVLLALPLGATLGQIAGYVTCDLGIFEPCTDWSTTGRTLGGAIGVVIAVLITLAIYSWRESRLDRRPPSPPGVTTSHAPSRA